MNTVQEQVLKNFLDSIDSEAKDQVEKPKIFLDTFEKIHAFDDRISENDVKKQILDGIEEYKKLHGCEPHISLVEGALKQANIYLDDVSVGEPSGSSTASNSRALMPMEAFVSIKTTIMGALPFAHYLPADTKTGEAKFVMVSHEAGNKCGMYQEGDGLDGLNGGNVFINTDRTHKLSSTDQSTYTGKITPVMTALDTCDQAAEPHPLYPGRTQLFVNGVVVATSSKGSPEVDTLAGVFKLHDKEISISNASVNIKTGAVTITFTPALEANDEVKVRGFLNVEVESANYDSPAIKLQAETRSIYATPYRTRVTVTPEAKAQFQNELGIEPTFEAMMQARALISQENLYKSLDDGCSIAKFNGLSYTFDYKWAESGANRSQAELTQELLTLVSTASQDMVNLNNSHGVSHIYVDDKMRAIILSLDSRYFVQSGITDKPGSYRLGRLCDKYEVYYTPKVLQAKGVNMLLIGANASNPKFNPVIAGDATPPLIENTGVSTKSPNSGSWLTGKSFLSQNPYGDYAKSFAAITVTNTALG